MKTLNNKTAVITGAGSGIGRELAYQLSEKGTRVLITDISEKDLQETVLNIQLRHKEASVHAFVFDMSDRQAVYDFADNVIDSFGQIDIVINNAGVALGKYSAMETDYPDWEWIFGINFWGTVYGSKAFLPHLIKRPEACLVNISSVFGLAGIAKQSPYCATKFAVRGFTEALRAEMLQAHPQLKIVSVHPGGIQTNIVRNARDKDEAAKAKIVKEFDDLFAKTSASKAAQTIIKGIQNKQERILIGRDAYMLDRIVRLLPAKYISLLERLRRWKGIE